MGFELELTQKAKEFLGEKGYDQQFGARPLNRAIQKYVEDAIADEILKGMKEGDVVYVDHEGTEEVLRVGPKPASKPSKKKSGAAEEK